MFVGSWEDEMIRSRKFARLAWLVSPLFLPGFATGQESTASPFVAEARVVITEDGPKQAGEKASGPTAARREAVVNGRTLFRYSPGVPPLGQAQVRRPFAVLKTQLGMELAEADDALRSQLQLPAGQGVVVVGVDPEGAADQSGLKANDVIVNLGDAKVRGLAQARARLAAIGKEPIEVKLIRAGKETRLTLAGPKHGERSESEASEYWIGVPVAPVDAVLRSHLAELPADAGLIANDVVAESPAALAGLKKNDILVKLGDKALTDATSLVAQVQATDGKPTPLELLRAGKPIKVTITPVKRARVVINGLRHQSDYFNFVFPKPGVQVFEPKQHEVILKEVNKLVEAQGGNPYLNPRNIHLEMLTSSAKAGVEEANVKIEAALKDVKASIEELKKAIEAMKKPGGE